jgi:hypothetical protein
MDIAAGVQSAVQFRNSLYQKRREVILEIESFALISECSYLTRERAHQL